MNIKKWALVFGMTVAGNSIFAGFGEEAMIAVNATLTGLLRELRATKSEFADAKKICEEQKKTAAYQSLKKYVKEVFLKLNQLLDEGKDEDEILSLLIDAGNSDRELVLRAYEETEHLLAIIGDYINQCKQYILNEQKSLEYCNKMGMLIPLIFARSVCNEFKPDLTRVINKFE